MVRKGVDRAGSGRVLRGSENQKFLGHSYKKLLFWLEKKLASIIVISDRGVISVNTRSS